MDNLFKGIADAQRKSRQVIVVASVCGKEGKVILPIHPQSLWSLSSDNALTCTITISPSPRGQDWREIAVALQGEQLLFEDKSPGSLSFFETVCEEAVKNVAYLEGYIGPVLCYDVPLTEEEVRQHFLKWRTIV